MAIKITDTELSSDLHPHTAELRHSQDGDAWRVSWLPGRTVGRNEAITAMVLAEDVSAVKDLGPGHRHWPFIEGWSAELGLAPEQAVARITKPREIEREA